MNLFTPRNFNFYINSLKIWILCQTIFEGSSYTNKTDPHIYGRERLLIHPGSGLITHSCFSLCIINPARSSHLRASSLYFFLYIKVH